MCNCSCEYCEDYFECKISHYCEKLNKFCIARNICNPDIMKIEGCYTKLKQQDLFSNLPDHNQ